MTERRDVIAVGEALLSHIDALMPYIEQALSDAWDKGDYINGPQFGAAIEAFRAAIADTHPKGQDAVERLGS